MLNCSSIKCRKRYKILFAAYIIIVLILSVLPQKACPTTGCDKINHLAAFAVFPLLYALASKKHDILKTIIYAFSFAVLIEIIQKFIPWRSCELGDIAADILGIALGVILLKVLKEKNIPDGDRES